MCALLLVSSITQLLDREISGLPGMHICNQIALPLTHFTVLGPHILPNPHHFHSVPTRLGQVTKRSTAWRRPLR